MLHPSLKWQFFRNKWAKKKDWLRRYEKVLADVWSKEYKDRSPPPSRPSSQGELSDILDQFLVLHEPSGGLREDEYQAYCCTIPTPELSLDLPIQWWSTHEPMYPSLAKWAFNVLSIPAMSAECERVFSSTGILLEPRRNRLLDDIVEANECLRAWKKQGLF